MGKRSIYLHLVSLEEALDHIARIGESKRPASIAEEVAIVDSLGRVTAEPVFAAISSPSYNAAAMDGVAVHSADTFGASESAPVRLELGQQTVAVDTGDPLPAGFDAVIMIEDVQPVGDKAIEVIAPASPWQHVRPTGEDIVATELILPENHQIRPIDIGAMLAGGLVRVKVYRKPRVTIIPTGTELVEVGHPLEPGRIIESNSHILAGLVTLAGGVPQRLPPVADDYEAIKKAIVVAVADSDLIIINAGSSAGREDYTLTVARDMGQVLFHGVQIRPGKPAFLGLVKGKPLLGIPGYPVSAVLTFELLARPLIARWAGIRPPALGRVRARMSQKVLSPLGAEEFLRVRLGRVGEHLIATPLGRGAGALMSLVRADGVVRIPSNSEGLLAGEEVEVELYKAAEEIENTIVVRGSHDPCLDILASELKRRFPQLTLSSAHVGSIGGLLSLRRGEAHLAGIHLLDEESGEYNIPYIERFLPGRKVALVNLVYRQQGLMVAPGNPKQIRGLLDLARPGVTFINRQRAAGTRLLLDLKLREMGIIPESITGYEREVYTHMAVAAAVAGGTSDVGLGVLSAARALHLDFIPIAQERYDLAIAGEYYESPGVQRLLEVIRSKEFQERVAQLGGYDVSDTGKLLLKKD
ncbi:MAG: molybdopterin biosynthesis protein [Chloroflexi bacterium]|nr:molybdopterin biosynthesis protein [Chloroflexota bacterium]